MTDNEEHRLDYFDFNNDFLDKQQKRKISRKNQAIAS
jgi:hypothetical protein